MLSHTFLLHNFGKLRIWTMFHSSYLVFDRKISHLNLFHFCVSMVHLFLIPKLFSLSFCQCQFKLTVQPDGSKGNTILSYLINSSIGTLYTFFFENHFHTLTLLANNLNQEDNTRSIDVLTVHPPQSVSISQKTEWLSPSGYIVYIPLPAPEFLRKTSAQSTG